MRARSILMAMLLLPAAFAHAAPTPASAQGHKMTRTMDPALATRLAQVALECVQKEYPNKIAHVLKSDADARTPRQLYPAFYGCYDWHSAVHGHWLLARLTQLHPDAAFAPAARKALAENLSTANLQGELVYLQNTDAPFERPYGLAWLLQLSAQLHGWDDPQAQQWARDIEPVEALAAQRIKDWLPKLTQPIRVGEHSQTAFAFGLIWDWAQARGGAAMATALTEASRRFYLKDTHCPLAYEPSGQDFLSPCIAEADLMRRILPQAEFARWLGAFMPQIPRGKADADWLPPGVVLDKTDGKLAHLDGLNLSRAWMLDGIVRSLPSNDPRLPSLRAAAQRHREVGMAAIVDMHYMGSHWLGTFATYLMAPPGA